MFNLNDEKEFNTGGSIFNGGNTGLVKDVTISVEVKDDQSNKPDYKLLVTDNMGTINEGFYYPTPNSSKSEEDNIKVAKMHVGRVLHVAKAVMGDEYEFPQVSSAKEAYDTLFELIQNNSKGKKFNVYTTYGSKQRPSKYLGLRFFDFIESATENSKLFPKPADNMEQIIPDAPSTDNWML